MIFAVSTHSGVGSASVSKSFLHLSDTASSGINLPSQGSQPPAEQLRPTSNRFLPNGDRRLIPPANGSETVSSRPVIAPPVLDSLPADSIRQDSVKQNNFLDNVISGKNTDSLIYDVKNKLVYIYKDGDVNYGNMNITADYMRVSMDSKLLYAHGISDTLGNSTRPVLTEGNAKYTMDTVNYNIETQKGKMKGIATQEGEGFLLGDDVKKMHDNTIHIHDGKYTTCDDPNCPHFYLAMTKAKVIPGQKVIAGYSYLVLEEVPIFFPGIPEAFFPISSGRTSGFIIPSYGEEWIKGFFLRDGGYYWAINDHIDLTLLGGIYTKGSWELSARSSYTKRYKYNGNFAIRFSNDVVGEKGESDYSKGSNFHVAWTHSQKPSPVSNFSASVNLSSGGYSKNNSQSISDYLNTQTNSSISYSTSFPGTPFSLSTNMSVSQNSSDPTNATYMISFPNAVINMSRINPFKRKEGAGKQRWYEKIALSYTGTIGNSVTTKEKELFQEEMFKNMKYGIKHTIPVSTSMNVLNYINISPNANYNERWYFRRIDRAFDNGEMQRDTTYGFYRVYDFNAALSASTTVYGTWEFTNPNVFLRAVRHTVTPTIGVNFTPDFGDPSYGYWKTVPTDETGTKTETYSPFANESYGVPGRGPMGALTFSLKQTLEAKVLSKTDTTGTKKVKIIDDFTVSGNYNFLADSLKLSDLNLSLRATIPGLKNFGINLQAVWDLYEWKEIDGVVRKVDRLAFGSGGMGHITRTGWSAGYTFNGGQQGAGAGAAGGGAGAGRTAINNINTHSPLGINDAEFHSVNPFYFDPDNPMDPLARRDLMVGTYYDFSIPWSFGFNYTISYNNNLGKKTVNQSVTFNGNMNLTPKWAITFNGGLDLQQMKMTPILFTLTRDLHCWQFNFNWVPIGYRRSWSFNISVKSQMLRDLKYDKESSHYDNLNDD